MDAIIYHRPDRMKELLSANWEEELRTLFGGAESVPSELEETLKLFWKVRIAILRVDREAGLDLATDTD